MKRETITRMLNGLDDRYISEAADLCPDAMRESPGRIAPMKRKRRITFVLAAALLLSLGIAAYAAGLFGLRELYANPNRGEMPEEAAALITEQSAAVEGEGWRARVLESYCDEGSVLLTVQLSADAGYLVAPGAEDPNSPLWTIGLEGEGTLGDYARREGKTLLFAEIALDREALALSAAGMHFANSSPQEMTVYFEGTRHGGAAGALETSCTVLVLPWPPEAAEQEDFSPAVERRSLLLTLQEVGGTPLGRYAPADAYAVPGVELGELRLTQTPLGLSLRLEMSQLDPEAAKQLLTLCLEGVEFHGSGSLDTDGISVFDQGRGSFGKRPVIRFLDWDKNTLAEVTFEKIG